MVERKRRKLRWMRKLYMMEGKHEDDESGDDDDDGENGLLSSTDADELKEEDVEELLRGQHRSTSTRTSMIGRK